MTIITCARCTRSLPHEARGLCHRCYNLAHWRGLHEVYTLGRRAPGKENRRAWDWRAYKRMKRHA